ncbi:MAG TPA: IS3 family transposase, partial [Chloroflexi bacterium]|nr:IS3 family transposase [Chloroflexota bacterium]
MDIRDSSWVDCWNHRRLHGACNDVPPAEFEALYYAQQPAVPVA